jgi:hypothetical protein
MDGNTHFPDAGELVTTLKEKLNLFSSALVVSINGNKVQKQITKAARIELFAIMHRLCTHVNYYARGNKLMITSSGYTVSGDGTGIIVMEPLEKLALKHGSNSGTIVVKSKKGYGTHVVTAEYALGDSDGPTTLWTLARGYRCTITITGLPPGQWLWVRVTSSGRRSQKIIASLIRIMVV